MTSDEPASATLALADLPEAVRARVVALTAQVLPDVVRVPPALRRFADFAPQRRARLGARVIALSLESDSDFRALVGTQVEAQSSPAADDLVGVAATGWLTRPDGWSDAVLAAIEEYDERAGESPAVGP